MAVPTYGALMSGRRILSHPTPRPSGVASSDVSSLGSARKCTTGGTALKPKLRCSSGWSQFSAATSGLNMYTRRCMPCTVRSVRFSFWRGAVGMLTWVPACCGYQAANCRRHTSLPTVGAPETHLWQNGSGKVCRCISVLRLPMVLNSRTRM